jgi:choline dehydrogenase
MRVRPRKQKDHDDTMSVQPRPARAATREAAVTPLVVDHLVVGAGTAGCVVAGGLAAAGDRSVLVIEAGGSDAGLRTQVPAATKWMYGRPAYDWQHPTEGDTSLQGRADRWAAGRVVGGTSTINGTVYVRGSVQDYDAWRDAGNPGWGHADLLPLFRQLEASPIGDERWRGRSGPLPVEQSRSLHTLTQATAAAMRAAGLPWTDDMNGEQFEGAGWAQVTQRAGLRVNAARAFLHPALRDGPHPVRLLSGARCTGLVIEQGRCTGAHFVHQGQSRRVIARQGVTLCAGALKSPQLLLLSGIGPAPALAALGIAVHADLPGVGQGLMDHPVAKLSARVRGSTYNVETGPITGMGHLLNYVLRRRGLLASPHAQLVAHVRSTPAAPRPDVQIAFYPYAFERQDGGVKRARTPAVMFTVLASHGRGQGTVTLASNDPLAPPRIHHELLADEADRRTLIDGCRLVHRVASQAPLAGEIRSWMDIDPAGASDADWLQYLRARASVAHHPAGTCRMGDDGDAVVDARLRVRGIEGLWVADNSVMPSPVSGNTQAAAYVIGAKATALLRADAG